LLAKGHPPQLQLSQSNLFLLFVFFFFLALYWSRFGFPKESGVSKEGTGISKLQVFKELLIIGDSQRTISDRAELALGERTLSITKMRIFIYFSLYIKHPKNKAIYCHDTQRPRYHTDGTDGKDMKSYRKM